MPEGADLCEFVCITSEEGEWQMKVWARILEVYSKEHRSCLEPFELVLIDRSDENNVEPV